MGERGSILLVDDDPAQVGLVSAWLGAAFPDAPRRIATCGQDALTAVESADAADIGIMLLDLGLPDIVGLQVLARTRQRHPHLPIAVLTLATDVVTVVSAMRAGATDYLSKPVDRDGLAAVVGRALASHAEAAREARKPATGVDARPVDFPGIVGRSPVMRALYRHMERVASSDVTVLIQGESGTGKELVAKALHERGARKKGPFVAINCAAIPENLQESELFGHEKGSFTGAAQRQIGRFEQAQGGTLFLDEIGEVAPSLQAKLLRAVQERRFHRVGGQQEVRVDVRIVAATHRDLMHEVAAGRFREDLFYRLAVFELEVPPLRARGDDVLAIADELLAGLARRHAQPKLALDPAAVALMQAYAWPGNVRELQNALERAVVLAGDGTIRSEDLPRRLRYPPEPRAATESHAPAAAPVTTAAPRPATTAAAAPPLAPAPGWQPEKVDDVEKRMIVESIERTGGNISEVCRRLGIPRTSIYRKLKKYGIMTPGEG